MPKNIKDPKEIFPDITTDYKDVYGDNLISIMLYGSATGKDYRPGKSDINFMIVLSEEGIEHLNQAFEIVKKWRKRNVAIPVFLTENYVETSTDVFPIEYLNFRSNYVPVYGKDILKDLSFKPEFIRLQCEREIKGKLLLLRQVYLETSGKGRALKEVISQSIRAFVAIFEALLHVKGLELPKEKLQIIQAAAQAFDLDSSLFEKLLDVKDDRIKPGEDEMRGLFQKYLAEVRKLSKQVDTLGG